MRLLNREWNPRANQWSWTMLMALAVTKPSQYTRKNIETTVANCSRFYVENWV